MILFYLDTQFDFFNCRLIYKTSREIIQLSLQKHHNMYSILYLFIF